MRTHSVARAAVAALAVAALTLTGPSATRAAAEVAAEPLRLVPVPTGPPINVTTEHGYTAFPTAIRLADGTYLVTYRKGSSHASGDGEARVRWSVDGTAWSLPITAVPNPGTGTSSGGVDLAQDAAGRVYMLLHRGTSTGTASATNHQTWLTTSDDNGRTWTAPTKLPDITGAGQTVASSLLWMPGPGPDGTLLASTYGLLGKLHVGAVARSTDRGRTWTRVTPAGTNITVGRHVSEPQLTRLVDGSLLLTFRSDGAERSPGSGLHWQSQLMAMRSTNGGASWSAPWMVMAHASGLPSTSVAPTGEVLVSFRGFSEPTTDPLHFPVRVAVLDPMGQPVGGVLAQQWDVTGGNLGRYLYGTPVPGPDGTALLIYATEGPAGQGTTTGSASVYAVPLELVARPA